MNSVTKIMKEWGMAMERMDERDRYGWNLTMAATCLHDVPFDMRAKFFREYENMRHDVEEMVIEEESKFRI